ncbi:hypothetical protein PsYK624_069180 [Phanerochaete sordida]|uniref:Uncharacterized protein n=1 Tax=Phanerochaete sordida TaxID=48140 RepID=A0A9P3LDP2_9APHY|nr:hypothetical protein PsYK624_069180 [Phanerochaete sordida]
MSEASNTEDDVEPLGMSGLFRHPFRDRISGDFGQTFGLYDDRALPANERNMCTLSATIRAKPDHHIWYTSQT